MVTHLVEARGRAGSWRPVRALVLAHELGHVLVEQAPLQVLDREDVAVAHDQIDVIERDAFGLQAIVDDLLDGSRWRASRG